MFKFFSIKSINFSNLTGFELPILTIKGATFDKLSPSIYFFEAYL